MKFLFVFDVVWSQTDSDTIIVQETNQQTALARLKSRYPHARYYNLVRKATDFIE